MNLPFNKSIGLFETPGKGSAPCPCLPLGAIAPGTQVQIAVINGQPGFARRLADLGVRPGVVVCVVQHTASGVVLTAGGTRLALGPDAAGDILACPPAAPERTI